MKATYAELRDNEVGKKRDKHANNFYKEISVMHPSVRGTIATFRFYWAKNSEYCHCIAWFHNDEEFGSGYGCAVGGGYDKESVSMEYAIEQSGISLSEDIGGRGDSAMRSAVEAIAKAVSGKRSNFIIHYAHA
jgi:hypothetical protein